MDLTEFVAAVGADDPVTIEGMGTRGGGVPGVRCVRAPSGIEWLQPDEMTLACGAGTPVDDVQEALRAFGQRVALPAGGTVGGALAVGQADVRRLGDGPVRDSLLQARYVGADGALVKAGGPTVKNVSGFDLCRLLVGSRGTLGFVGEVILRSRPVAVASQWFGAPAADPQPVFAALYRPTAVLWDGARVWALLEGHPDDVADQARTAGLAAVEGPPTLPPARLSVAPSAVRDLPAAYGEFVAEVGVGVVHLPESSVTEIGEGAGGLGAVVHQGTAAVGARIKTEFDPRGRLNPGVVVG